MPAELSAVSGWDSPLAERYRLGGLLGRGSMADVHQAEDTRLRRPVAIKVFRPNSDPLAQQRFGEEARVLAQLSHPGLVAIYDAGIDGIQPYLVMQLVPGESLRSHLLGGPLTPPEVIRLGISLATAIDHVHQRGFVHRDIKPANILLDNDGDPHVADFGIALLIGAAELTNTTEIVGTIAYLAPEQILGTQITPAADIYALGLVLLESLTGKPVHPASGNLKSTLTRLHRPPHIPPTVPADLATLLATMTDTDPHRRPTAQHCADTLRTLNSPSPPAQPTPNQPPPARQRRRPYLVGAGVMTAAAAALALTLSPRAPAQGQFPNSAGSDQTTSHTVPSQPPAALAPASPTSAVPHTTQDTATPVPTAAKIPRPPAASTDPIPDRSSTNQPTTTTSQTSETTTTTNAATATTTAAATASDPPTT